MNCHKPLVSMPFTRSHTAYIKGVGILMIVMHNFLHWVKPNSGENEFYFDLSHVWKFIGILIDSPLESANAFFSYFGHYGVQLFILMSGYGLAISFSKYPGSSLRYVCSRIVKLYSLFLIGVLILLVYLLYTNGAYPEAQWWKRLFYKLLMISNLQPGGALSINGPWWFFSLIFQLYLLFPFVYAVTRKMNVAGFVLLCLLSYAIVFFTYTPLLARNIYIMANAPGHLPEFALGILLALNPALKINRIVVMLAAAVFLCGNIFPYVFPFTFLAVTVLMFNFFKSHFSRSQRNYSASHPLVFFGILSMYIFVVHGFLRPQIIMLIGDGGWFVKLVHALLFLLIATGAALVARYLHGLVTGLCVWLRSCRSDEATA